MASRRKTIRGLALGARFYAAEEAIGSWLSDGLVEKAFLAPLMADAILARCTHLAKDLNDPEPLTERKLLERARRWGYHHMEILSAEDSDTADVQVLIDVSTSGVNASARVSDAVAIELAGGVLDAFTRWVVAWSAALPGSVRLAVGACSPLGEDYPRPRPPRVSPIRSLGSLRQFAGIAWHEADPEEAPVLERMLAAPLPAGAWRRVEGDVLVLSFADDVRDPAVIRRARAAHEAWLTPLVPTELERGWNELGDRMVIPELPEPRAMLAFLDAKDSMGYVAIAPDDDAALAKLSALAKKKKLPDGTKLAGLRLIVPRREDVRRLGPRATSLGFDLVVYPGEHEGVLWEVDPP